MKRTIRKRIVSIIIPIMLMLGLAAGFPIKTHAASVVVTPSADTVYVGDTVTVTVTIYGDGIYGYSGYIDCDAILSGATGGFTDAADGSGSVSFSYSYTATGEGTASVYVSGCEVGVDDPEDPSNTIKEYAGDAVCTISIIEKDNGGGGTGGNAGGNDGNNPGGGEAPADDPGPINGNEVVPGSDNTNLSKLEAEGIKLTNEGHDIYSASVSNSVKKINLVAVPEDANAAVYGTGEHDLKVGENSFDITVVAENGYSRAYTVRITRRGDRIDLADLTKELAETKADTITVSLKDNDKLNKDMIDAVSKWGKTLHLNRYDTNGKLVYGWTLDGSAIAEEKDFIEFDPAVTFESNQMKKISALADNAPGKILNFAFSGDLPQNTSFTIPVGEDFAQGDTLFLYYYDEKGNTLKREGREIDVNSEEITLNLSHCSQFFLTKTFLQPKEEEKQERSNNTLYIIIGIAVVVIAILLVIFLLLRRKKQEQKGPKSREDISRHFERYDDFEDEDEYEKTDFGGR